MTPEQAGTGWQVWHRHARRFLKRRTTRFMRRLGKRDPESAPTRARYCGYYW